MADKLSSRRDFLKVILGLGAGTALATTGLTALTSREIKPVEISGILPAYEALQKGEGEFLDFQLLLDNAARQIKANSLSKDIYHVQVSLLKGKYKDGSIYDLNYERFQDHNGQVNERYSFIDQYGQPANPNQFKSKPPFTDFMLFSSTDITGVKMQIDYQPKLFPPNERLDYSEYIDIRNENGTLIRTHSTSMSSNDNNTGAVIYSMNEIKNEKQVNGKFQTDTIEYDYSTYTQPVIRGQLLLDTNSKKISSDQYGDEDSYADKFFMLQAKYNGTSIS